MKHPTVTEIEQLHKRHAPNDVAFQEIWQHCQIVRGIAVWCMDNSPLLDIDRQLVEAGCLLHDIGVYRLYDPNGLLDEKHYIRHGILGYELLKEEGFSEELCRFASHHTGVGLTANDVQTQNLALPVADYLAETTEEWLVMYADKFHSKLPSEFNSVQWYAEYVGSKFGQDKAERFKAMVAEFGEPPIKEMAKVYKQNVNRF